MVSDNTELTNMDKNIYSVRGMRNKNPFNLEFHERNKWQGQTGTDGRFAIFNSFENGLRAGIINLRNGYWKQNKRTINSIIEKYLGNDNGKAEYKNFLSGQTGIDINQELSFEDLMKVAFKMIHFENGKQYFTWLTFREIFTKYF